MSTIVEHSTHLNLIFRDASSSEPVVPAVHGLVVDQHHLEVAALLARQGTLCLTSHDLHTHLHCLIRGEGLVGGGEGGGGIERHM